MVITRPERVKEMPKEKSDEDSMKYYVPLLGVHDFKSEKTELDLAFTGELEGVNAKAYITPGKTEATEIRVLFDGMKTAPKDKKFVLWLFSPEKEYTKLGHVMNLGIDDVKPEIYGKTALKDFGLLVTLEEKDGKEPTGKIYSAFKVGGN